MSATTITSTISYKVQAGLGTPTPAPVGGDPKITTVPKDEKTSSKITHVGKSTIKNHLSSFEKCQTACLNGDVEKVKEFLKFPKITKSKDFHLLFFASVASPEIIKLLFDNKNQALDGLYNGTTLMHVAAENGCLETMKWLYGKNRSLIEKYCINGFTPCQIAAQKGYLSIIEYFYDRHPLIIYQKDKSKLTLIHHAAFNEHTEILDYFHKKDRIDKNFIHEIAGKNCPKSLNTLFKQGFKPNEKLNGQTPLHIAAENCAFKNVEYLLKYSFQNNIDLKINASDFGKTLIVLAMEKGHKDIVKLLIQKGVDLTGVSNNQETLLHLAAFRGYEELLKELLEKEVCKNLINLKDNSKNTPLHKVCFRNYGLKTINIVKLLMAVPGIEMNQKNNGGDTPFHLALRNGHTTSAYRLLNTGSLDLSVNYNNEFAFDLAIKLGRNAPFLDLILETPMLSESYSPDKQLEEYYSQCFLEAKENNFVQGQLLFLLKSALVNIANNNFILSVKRLHAAIPLLNQIKGNLKNQNGCQALENYILKKIEMIENEPIKAYTKTFRKIPLRKNSEEAIAFSLEEKQNKLKLIRESQESENRKELTTKFKDLLIYLIAETQADLGAPPVQWACVGRGCLAREDMTPRSKIEFGFLIEEKTEQSLLYFTSLYQTLEIKIANLFRENPTADGFFDLKFEVTESQMTKIQSIKKLKPKKMGMICYIEGKKELVESYENQIKKHHLELGKRMLGGVLIDSSFDPLMPNDHERNYQLYIKSLEGLSLCFKVEGKNLFEKIEGLAKKGIFCKEGTENLKHSIHQFHKPKRSHSITEELHDTLFSLLSPTLLVT